MQKDKNILRFSGSKSNKVIWIDISSLVILLVLILFTLFAPYGLNGENWLYWFFSKVFSETGRFIIFERSSLYTVYLLLFNWMDYPTSIIVEYLVTASITTTAFYLFFRRLIPVWATLLASILWLPCILIWSIPQVQLLGLAFSFFAILFRLKGENRNNIVFFYSFMLIAYSFRPTYQFMILLFLCWDIWKIFRNLDLKESFFILKPKLRDWPIFTIVSIIICFHIFQSPHKWNNAWGMDTKWFPVNGKTLSDASAIQSWNWEYIRSEFGTTEGKDFYFTNRELFGDANTVFSSFLSNPIFIINHTISNLERFFVRTSGFLTSYLHFFVVLLLLLMYKDLSNIYKPKLKSIINVCFIVLFCVLLLGLALKFPPLYYICCFAVYAIIYGAIRYCKNNHIIILFIIGSFILIGLTVIHIPKDRYLIPFIPVMVFSAMWYGLRFKDFINNEIKNANKIFIMGGGIGFLVIFFYFITHGFELPEGLFKIITIFILLICSLASIVFGFLKFGELQRKTLVNFSIITVPIFLILFSNGPKLWSIVIRDTTSELLSNEGLDIHSYSENSMKKSFIQINALIKNCKGIMAFETSFIGAFMDVDLDKLYNIFEIPPFGTFTDITYRGLNPDRIDCLLISNTLKGPGGWGNNQKIRYDNYIKPYADQMVQLGAKVYDIPYYGQAIILNRE